MSMNKNKLQYLGSLNGYDCYLYKASLFDYFYTTISPHENKLPRKIRETLDYIRGGYKVLYLFEEEKPVAYLTLVKGGGRYSFSKKTDMILCNVWVDVSSRGKGIASLIYKAATTLIDLHCDYIYAFIRDSNIPSIKAAMKNGFKKNANLMLTKTKKYKIVAEGKLGLYAYKYSDKFINHD